MGKVLKMLEDLAPQIKNGYDTELHKEDLLTIAYICRVGILDRTDENPSWIRNNLTIRIPTGIISHKKRKMDEAIEMTIGKLLNLSSFDESINNIIESILLREDAFYQFEKILPFSLKRKLNS